MSWETFLSDKQEIKTSKVIERGNIMEFMEIIEITKNCSIDTGNIVFDYLFIVFMFFQCFFLWCMIKIIEYPILTAIAVSAYIFARAVDTRAKIEIRGNLWKWGR